MEKYDESFFRAKANRKAGGTWLVLAIIITIYYGIKMTKGEFAIGYFIASMFVGWTGIVVTAVVLKVQGFASKSYKWVLDMGYMLFYAVIAWTALDQISFIFILPLLSILILY